MGSEVVLATGVKDVVEVDEPALPRRLRLRREVGELLLGGEWYWPMEERLEGAT